MESSRPRSKSTKTTDTTAHDDRTTWWNGKERRRAHPLAVKTQGGRITRARWSQSSRQSQRRLSPRASSVSECVLRVVQTGVLWDLPQLLRPSVVVRLEHLDQIQLNSSIEFNIQYLLSIVKTGWANYNIYDVYDVLYKSIERISFVKVDENTDKIDKIKDITKSFLLRGLKRST